MSLGNLASDVQADPKPPKSTIWRSVEEARHSSGSIPGMISIARGQRYGRHRRSSAPPSRGYLPARAARHSPVDFRLPGESRRIGDDAISGAAQLRWRARYSSARPTRGPGSEVNWFRRQWKTLIDARHIQQIGDEPPSRSTALRNSTNSFTFALSPLAGRAELDFRSPWIGANRFRRSCASTLPVFAAKRRPASTAAAAYVRPAPNAAPYWQPSDRRP